jgi:HEAT repeat protein
VGGAAAELDKVLWASFGGAAPGERSDIAATAAALGAAGTLRAALDDTDAGVRRAAAENVNGLDEAHASALVGALSDEDAAVRVAAVRGLVGARAAGALAQAAHGPDLDVRIAALEALGQVGGPVARDALEAALTDGSERVRAAALRGLGRLGKDAAERLEEELGDGALDAREAAVAALGGAWRDKPLAELRARLTDETDADRRYAAALALAARADPPRGKGAEAAQLLDDVAAHGAPLASLAARIARAFAGRPDAMVAFLRTLRDGG